MVQPTPQQKALETLYRGKSAKRSPTLKQKQLNRSLNKPSAKPVGEAGKIKGSRSIQAQSKIRASNAATKAEFTRFGKQVNAAVGKGKANAAVNISKFGGGVKAKYGGALTGLKTLAVRQGAKGLTLGRAIAGSKFLAGANSVPGIALIVGNYYVWRQNIKTLAGIYGYDLDNIKKALPGYKVELPIPVKPPPFYGGQAIGVKYEILTEAQTYFNGRPNTYRPNKAILWGAIEDIYLTYNSRGNPPGFLVLEIIGKNQNGQFAYVDHPMGGAGFTAEIKKITINRVDGLPDTGGNISTGQTRPVVSGGNNFKDIMLVLPSKKQSKPTQQKPSSQPTPTKEKKGTPVITPVPPTIPVPVPQSLDTVRFPDYVRDGLPIVTDNPTSNDTAKKPSLSVKKTYYPNVGESPDEVRARVAKLRGKIDEAKKENGDEVAVVPTLPFLPIPGRVDKPGTTTKFKLDPSPTPTPTKVNPCKKGCGGGSGGISSGAGTSNNTAASEILDSALLLRIDRNTTRTVNTVTDANFGLAKIQDFAETAWKATRADKIVNALNTMLIIHNGFMLSNNMLDTVSEVAEVGLEILGIRDEEDKPIDIGGAIGSKIKGLLERTLGSSRYEELTKDLASKIRIYQSGANILYNIRSIFDSAQNIAETTGENVAFIGNALRRDGVVRENSYRLMPTDLEPSSRLLYRLERANDALDTIEEVISDAKDIKEELGEMKSNAEVFNKEVKEATNKQQLAIDVAKSTVTSIPRTDRGR